MRIALVLTILAIAVGTFLLLTNRAQPAPAMRRIPVEPRRRIAPELTAAAAAERWYDET